MDDDARVYRGGPRDGQEIEDDEATGRGVVVWLKDKTQVVLEDAFIAGIWNDELVVSRDWKGTGLDFDVARSFTLADIRRVEVVNLDGPDKDGESEPSWSLGWGEPDDAGRR